MKLSKLYLVAAVGAGLAGMPALALDVPATQPAAAPSWTSPSDLLNNIHAAQSPSDAVAAYARASASLGDDANAEHAFVVRMADFGLPEMAEVQAIDLTHRTPSEGLPWAVVAAMSARREQMDAAATQIDKAVDLAPDDDFVQRTAGQIVAWFDAHPDQAVPDDVKAAVDSVRKTLNSHKAFSHAYDDARQWQQQQNQNASPQTPSWSGPVQSPVYTTPDYTTNNYYSSDVYPNYPSYAPYYDSWWGSPNVIFFGGTSFFHRDDFFHHRGFDHDRFDHDRFGFPHNDFQGSPGGITFPRSTFGGSGFSRPGFTGPARTFPSGGIGRPGFTGPTGPRPTFNNSPGGFHSGGAGVNGGGRAGGGGMHGGR